MCVPKDQFFDENYIYVFFSRMNKKSTNAWVAWAIRKKRSIFFYETKVLDLTEFATVHPGGKRSLESYIYKDITQTLFKIYPHNREKTLQRLSQFIIGSVEIQASRVSEKKLTLNTPKSPSSSTKKKVCFKKKESNSQLSNSSSRKIKGRPIQKSRPKEKGSKKQKTHTSPSKGKENKIANFEVSIKLIQSSKAVPEENLPNRAKKRKANKQWFDQQLDCEELKQGKSEISCPAFATKQKVAL